VKLSYKLWLDCRGRAFGDGPARLLEGVEQAGSLRKAAAELSMSYNKAWRILRAAEQRLGFALLDRSVGGPLGGGSQLTPRALDLMRRYRGLMIDVEKALDTVFDRHFADWEDLPADDAPDLPSCDDSEQRTK
jgi:molybdate transport system regulatory protein